MATNDQTVGFLNQARQAALTSASVYPQVVAGVLSLLGPTQPVELRRWGADFLAETFASPVIITAEKQQMCLSVLDLLQSYLNREVELSEEEDSTVIKSAVQCAASIYPLIFSHTVANSSDKDTWGKMAAIKSSILRRMDSAPAGVRICCIKFVARVVQVQTPGVITDPRRPESNEISLALVPRDHPTIPPSILEAEASGLLDRLLGVLQDNIGDALIITATLNSLSSLVQRRASISAKILSVLLNYNPLKLASPQMSGKDRVTIRSMTRTTTSFLLNVLKRNPNNALAPRIQLHIERLRHGLNEVFEPSNKRPGPDEPTDGLDNFKRQKIDAAPPEALQVPPTQFPPPLPSGPVTYSQLYNLNPDPRAAGFHVEAIPHEFVYQLVPAILGAVEQAKMDEVLNIVRGRYLEVERRPPPSHATGEDEDDDYDPIMGFGDPEQTINHLEQLPPDEPIPEVAIGPFHLPLPLPLTEEEKGFYSETAKERLFISLQELDARASNKKSRKTETEKSGFNRLATTSHDRDGWITLLTRLATRPDFALEQDSKIKQEHGSRAVGKKGKSGTLPSKLREAFHKYVMDDWRRRIDVAISWLNEEWYADRLIAKSHPSPETEVLPNYWYHTLRLLDSLVPYLDTKDGRYLIRLLSEIPTLAPAIFERIKTIALDPERVQLAAQTLLYVIMLKPPAREMAVQCALEMWKTNPDAKIAAGKILAKWRPQALQDEQTEVKQEA